MALVLKDRVKETTTTTGTGTLTLAGAATGFQSFSVIGNGNTTYYCIVDSSAGAWEVGIGTYTSSGTTLSRDTILESSNSGSAVSFGSGSKDVFCTYPAEKSLSLNASGNVGIGTTSPSAPLAIGRVDSGSEGGQIDLCRSSDNASSWGIDVYGSTSTPSFRIVDNVAGSTRFEIDGNGIIKGAAGNLMLISGTSVSASGTAVEFTGIPSWVKRITIQMAGISTNGTSAYIVQIGSGGFTTSGYSSQSWGASGGGVVTGGFAITAAAQAALIYTGQAVLTKYSSNAWISSGIMAITSTTSNAYQSSGYSPDLGAALDRVRVTTVGGSNSFDAGTINILYE